MTQLVCSDYGCRRTTVSQFRDDRPWNEKRDGKGKPKPSLKNILCNVHAGAMKRSRYKDDPLPLPEADRERLFKEQAAIDAENRAKADAARQERERRDIEDHRAQWAFMSEEAHYAIDPDTDRASFEEEPTFEGSVWTGEKPARNWETRWFNIEPSVRYYRAVNRHERQYPYIIRVSRGSNLSPNEARALAAALVEAAAKAEELNEKRAPEGVRSSHEHQFHYGRCTVAGCSAVRTED